MYGTQTNVNEEFKLLGFENDVKMYGTQTYAYYPFIHKSLRMM